MELEAKIKEDLKAALKGADTETRDVLRSLSSDIKNEFIKTRSELEDKQVLAIIRRNIKARKDAMEQFAQGGRQDLVAKEQAELTILEKYMPALMSEQEIEAIVNAVIAKMDEAEAKNFGSVMKEVMNQTEGRADGSLVSQMVKKALIG